MTTSPTPSNMPTDAPQFSHTTKEGVTFTGGMKMNDDGTANFTYRRHAPTGVPRLLDRAARELSDMNERLTEEGQRRSAVVDQLLKEIEAARHAPALPGGVREALQIVFNTLSEVEALEEASVAQFQGPEAEPSASQRTLASLRGMLEHRLTAPKTLPECGAEQSSPTSGGVL